MEGRSITYYSRTVRFSHVDHGDDIGSKRAPVFSYAIFFDVGQSGDMLQ